ncbi:Retrovirus-related Pol polyprotein from transposon TNT 1-94 [Gossypium australe]|uniref:Retrovirus-related Pol polyprotein from transposon TNT 1-94 n=1 Tax=Gossypium australe TaxID=47621 RepID=A0A5B6WWE7_9ROSI|nr:Retrovirus-related Pol polyprotein from transposon TNT 1-94 [Gossypium australe]
MAIMKYDISLLDHNTKFVLWQVKIQAISAHMDLEDALPRHVKQVELQIDPGSTTESTTKVSIGTQKRVDSSPQSVSQYFVPKNRPKREIKPPKRFAEADLVAYALNVAEDIDANQEPSTYSKAISCKDSGNWMISMQGEMESPYKNRIWDLVKLPKGKKVVCFKWMFKKKKRAPRVEEPKYKTKLVAKSYN